MTTVVGFCYGNNGPRYFFSTNKKSFLLHQTFLVKKTEVMQCKFKKLKQLSNIEWSKITNKWDKVFKNGPSKIYGRQPLKPVFQKFYFVHS